MDETQVVDLAGSGYALALQMLRHRDDADDVLQDSLHTLFKKRHLYQPSRGELRVWFLKIVRNRCLDVLRRRARRKTEAAEMAEIRGAEERPDEVAEKREMLELVKRHLMEMPAEQREIILLRDFHQLSYAEVADVLGVPIGTVMSRLHRARAELRKRVSGQ